jgi:hypothetical protein
MLQEQLIEEIKQIPKEKFLSFPRSAWECSLNRSAVRDAGASPN